IRRGLLCLAHSLRRAASHDAPEASGETGSRWGVRECQATWTIHNTTNRRSTARLSTHCVNLKIPRDADMPARVSEAIVLRTYPLKEADLIVSFLTRDCGKLRGVAKRARRPKGGFGASLERLSHGKMFYFQRETRELVTLDACELIHSHFGLHGDNTVSVALDFIAEVSEQFLPAAEVNEKFFRLLLAVLEHLRESPRNVWRSVTYFSLWAVRLAGVLPP